MTYIRCGLAVIAVIAFSSQSFAAERKCASRAELRTGIAYIMPNLVKGVVTKCAATLSPDTYLAKDGEALIARYAGQSVGAERDIAALFKKFGPQSALNGADQMTTAALVENLVSAGVQSAIKPEMCTDISTAMALLDPLPAANMNGLVELIIVKVDEGNARKAARQSGQTPQNGAEAKKPSAPILCDSLTSAAGLPE